MAIHTRNLVFVGKHVFSKLPSNLRTSVLPTPDHACIPSLLKQPGGNTLESTRLSANFVEVFHTSMGIIYPVHFLFIVKDRFVAEDMPECWGIPHNH